MSRYFHPSRKAQRAPFSLIRRPRGGKGQISRSAQHDAEGPVSPQGEEAIRSLGSGSPLPIAERAFFEPRLGADLGAVRVHQGDQAAAAAESISARAFTLGSDVVFGQGEFRPGSAEGRRLIAHELAHTVQQGAVKAGTVPAGTVPAGAVPAGTVESVGLPSDGAQSSAVSVESDRVRAKRGPSEGGGELQRRVQRRALGGDPGGDPGRESEEVEEPAIDLEAIRREKDSQRRLAAIDLLDKGKAEGIGIGRKYEVSDADRARGLDPIDLAMLHQADLLTAAAEADARLFVQEKEQVNIALRSARRALRRNRRRAFGAWLSRRKQRRSELKGARGGLKDEVARLKALRKNLNWQDEMRGHEVEWLSSIIQTGESSFAITQPFPGHRKANVNKEAGSYTQPSVNEASQRELELVGIVGKAVADLHTHPYTSDKRQFPSAAGEEGLVPAGNDRKTANKYRDRRQGVLNPRGKVISIGVGDQKDRELRPGLTGSQAGSAKEPGPMAEAKQRLGLPSFEALVQLQLRVLKAVDRQEVVEMQRRLPGS